MENFANWLKLQEGVGDVRQVRIKKLDPHGWIHFELIQGNQPTGQLGTSSKIISVKTIRNIGDGTFLTQISSESGTVYMTVINQEMINLLSKTAAFNVKHVKAANRVQQHIDNRGL